MSDKKKKILVMHPGEINELLEELAQNDSLLTALSYLAHLESALQEINEAIGIVGTRLIKKFKTMGMEFDESKNFTLEQSRIMDEKCNELVEKIINEVADWIEKVENDLLENNDFVKKLKEKGSDLDVEEVFSVFRSIFVAGIIARLIMQNMASVRVARRVPEENDDTPNYIS